ncbi:hypothetical protein ACG7TL_006357 [Trametes sanguinea]
MPIDPATVSDWDELAASLGNTPQYDSDGQVVAIGKPEQFKQRYYVVWHGRAVGIFLNWGITQAMVYGFEGAAFKKYSSLDSARRAWAAGPTGRGWQPPRPRPAARTSPVGTTRPFAPISVSASASRQSSPVREEWRFEVVNTSETIPVRLSASPELEEHDISDSDDEKKYWADVPDLPDDVPLPSAISSSVSSVSSILAMTATSITSGTLSPHTVCTPVPSSPEDSPPATPAARTRSLPVDRAPPTPPPTQCEPISRSISCRIKMSPGPQPIKKSMLEKVAETPARRPSPAIATTIVSRDVTTHGECQPASIRPFPSPSKKRVAGVFPEVPRPTPPNAAGPALLKALQERSSPAREPATASQPAPAEPSVKNDVYVVVRGDRPGVYFERDHAMLMLGTSPGMKLVRFHSRKKALWYFVQEYMAGRVGIPVVVLDDN